MTTDKQEKRRPPFCINDHTDILVEVLKRLDGRSLCAAACVCRLWRALADADSVWEHLCLRRVPSLPSSSPGVRPVVSALGGYRRLYMLCVRHLLTRLSNDPGSRWRASSAWDELQLSLSLFCVDYYERLGGRFGDSAASSSLMFLCKPVNV
ncbi:F-box protein SNE [Punica granatum]|uniref:F-box domain-containing protein n=2 Tax=Punica granatum TaxID=22663 RepID=A0A218X4A2_PUNGR|nr:F-box protein SNE [Punica granatum]OWM79744.1 hypothetical protein CDL15_Pgr023156 [Punica granatum]PKI53765.1 hypothetical protein CRG98_025846 [Punica granatum]